MKLSTLFEFDFAMKGERIAVCCLNIYKIFHIYVCIYVYMQDEMHGWAVHI